MTAILRDTAGMTVVEVIIALGVIVIGLLALIATMPLGTSAIAESNLKTTATFLAQQRLEQLKNAVWTDGADTLCGAGLNGTAACPGWPDEAYNTIIIATGGTDVSYPLFRRQVRIADCSVVVCSGIPVNTTNINTLRQVTVTVSFHPIAGTGAAQDAEEGVRFVTLVAKR
jgi:type II secretory pathway pseudopilin PulG